MNLPLPIRVPPYVEMAIAAEAQVDPKTVRRVLAGLPTRPGGRDRVLRVAAKLGLGTFNGVSEEALEALRARLVEQSKREREGR